MANVTTTGLRKPYPGDNVQEIMRLLEIAYEVYIENHYASKFTFATRLSSTAFVKKLVIPKLARSFVSDFPKTDSLALIEAVSNLIEDAKGLPNE